MNVLTPFTLAPLIKYRMCNRKASHFTLLFIHVSFELDPPGIPVLKNTNQYTPVYLFLLICRAIKFSAAIKKRKVVTVTAGCAGRVLLNFDAQPLK